MQQHVDRDVMSESDSIAFINLNNPKSFRSREIVFDDFLAL